MEGATTEVRVYPGERSGGQMLATIGGRRLIGAAAREGNSTRQGQRKPHTLTAYRARVSWRTRGTTKPAAIGMLEGESDWGSSWSK